MNEKILIAEDDPAILAGLADLLRLEGYDVLEAANGAAAIELYKKSPPDLILMDVMMPFMNGYDVCREIRRSDGITPILMLTAKGEEVDKVIGLGLGADDYIVKPFGIAELTARIRSALRRVSLAKKTSPDSEETELIMGDAVVNFGRMTVQKGKELPVQLTPKETELLRYFARNPDKVISRETLLDAVWGIEPDCDITTRSVDQHVARLRHKIETKPSEPRIIITVHGAGYRLKTTD